MFFSSLIHGSYPRVFRQCFLINRFDPIDLLSAAYYFTLAMGSSVQTVNVCVKGSKCASTTDAFEAKFGPLNCISKLRFQILTPPRIKLIC